MPHQPLAQFGSELTPREQEVWKLLATRALTNKAIGRYIGCVESTVKMHLKMLHLKLGTTNRIELVLLWHGIDKVTTPLEIKPVKTRKSRIKG